MTGLAIENDSHNVFRIVDMQARHDRSLNRNFLASRPNASGLPCRASGAASAGRTCRQPGRAALQAERPDQGTLTPYGHCGSGVSWFHFHPNSG